MQFTLFHAAALIPFAFFQLAATLTVSCPPDVSPGTSLALSWEGQPLFNYELVQESGNMLNNLAAGDDTSDLSLNFDTNDGRVVPGMAFHLLVRDSTGSTVSCDIQLSSPQTSSLSSMPASSSSSLLTTASSSSSLSPSSLSSSSSSSVFSTSSVSAVTSSSAPVPLTTSLPLPSHPTTSRSTVVAPSFASSRTTTASHISTTSLPTSSALPILDSISTSSTSLSDVVPSSTSSVPPVPSFAPDGTPITGGPSDEGMEKDRSIPFIIGIMSALAVIAALGFAYRFYRNRRRMTASQVYNHRPSDSYSKGRGFTDSNGWSYGTPITSKEVAIAPPEHRWSMDELHDVPLLGMTGIGAGKGMPTRLPSVYNGGQVGAGHLPDIKSDEKNDAKESIMDSARASSIMLPPVAHTWPSEPAPPIPSIAIARPLSRSSFSSSRRPRPLSHEASTILDDAVFELPLPATSPSSSGLLTSHRSPFPGPSPSSQQTFPTDARAESDRFSMFSTTSSTWARNVSRPVAPLPPLPHLAISPVPVPRSARSRDEYPMTPTTPFESEGSLTPHTGDRDRDSGAFVRQMLSGPFVASSAASENPFADKQSAYAPTVMTGRASSIFSVPLEMQAVSDAELQRLARKQAQLTGNYV